MSYVAHLLCCLLLWEFTNSEAQTTPEAPSTDGLESADVAAIVLGCLLLVILIGVIVVCILIKNGIIFVKPEVTNRVEGVPDFSTTPFSLKTQSYLAFQEEKNRQSKKNSKYIEKEPIIYMYDDVYHPPNSRPLPGNDVKAKPYGKYGQKQSTKKQRPTRRSSSQDKSRLEKSRDLISQQTQTNTDDLDFSKRVFFITNFKANMPYSEKKEQTKHHTDSKI